MRLSRSLWSSFLTDVKATQEAVFLCTSCPRRDLPFTMQYGTPFLRQRAGSQTTSSIGSTSWAMATSLAALFSTSVVTWLRPYLMTVGFLALVSLPSFFRLRGLQQTNLLFLTRLWLILLEETKQLTCLVLVDCHVELVECRWDLQTLKKNALHALELDVFGPSCEAGYITLGLNVATKAEISWSLFEERILRGLLALCCKWCCGHLFSSFRGCLLSHGPGKVLKLL